MITLHLQHDPGNAFAIDRTIQPKSSQRTNPTELNNFALQKPETITDSDIACTIIANCDYAGVGIQSFDKEGALDGLGAQLDGSTCSSYGFLT
jgi:hypothetical protein